MLTEPIHNQRPFPFFLLSPAFSEEDCAVLEQVFSDSNQWQERDGTFYQCLIRDISDELPATFIDNVIKDMRSITGLPLTDKCVVTAQQMLPGHIIGIHSDRPQLGYEIARLVVQLNKNWQAEDGGVLELFSSLEGGPEFFVQPLYNTAFGFLLHNNSYHAVTRTTRLRRTLVFNFWHAGNTVELETYIKSLFKQAHFSELPIELDSVASLAEASIPEETTFLASTTALALHRWGYEPATIVQGYEYSTGLNTFSRPISPEQTAIRLADWIARLYRNGFDIEFWKNLQQAIHHAKCPAQLQPIRKLCFTDSK